MPLVEEVSSDLDNSSAKIESLASSPEKHSSHRAQSPVFSIGPSDNGEPDDSDDSEDSENFGENAVNYDCSSRGCWAKPEINMQNDQKTENFNYSNPTENISIHGNRPKNAIWQICITMQLCAQNLSQFIKSRNQNIKKIISDSAEYKTSKHIFEQIVNGLKYVHDHNIIHRDIKPANIFFCENADFGGDSERVMIGDFGLSTSSDVRNQGFGDVSDRDLVSKSMITTGEKKNVQFFSDNVGTTSYAAPEQLSSKVYRAFGYVNSFWIEKSEKK